MKSEIHGQMLPEASAPLSSKPGVNLHPGQNGCNGRLADLDRAAERPEEATPGHPGCLLIHTKQINVNRPGQFDAQAFRSAAPAHLLPLYLAQAIRSAAW